MIIAACGHYNKNFCKIKSIFGMCAPRVESEAISTIVLELDPSPVLPSFLSKPLSFVKALFIYFPMLSQYNNDQYTAGLEPCGTRRKKIGGRPGKHGTVRQNCPRGIPRINIVKG